MSGYIGNIPVPQATQTRDVFTATSGQTSFATSGYTPGFLDVWLNGVKLVNGTDFTATNGSDVVLTSGAAASDIVEVLSYSTFGVNSQTFTGTTTLSGDLQATTATFSGAVTGTGLTLSGGVVFGATGGSVTSKTLDDYETGTYEVSITPSQSGTVTVDTNYKTASYERVGDFVHAHGSVDISAVGSPTGYFDISLPFTNANLGENTARSSGALCMYNNASANISDFVTLLVDGEASLRVYLGDGTTLQTDSAQQITSSSVIAFSITYRAV